MLRKYPRTRHLAGSRLQSGDHDLSVAPFDQIRGRHVVVEEKVDGANCGLSFDADANLRLQSRGHHLTGGPRERHFDRLKQWAATIADPLFDAIGDRYVVYGEWCYAKHTVFYDALPHPFLEFDVLDTTTGAFLDTPGRRAVLAGLPIEPVPVLWAGEPHRLADVTRHVGPSRCATVDVATNLRRTAERYGLDPAAVAAATDATGRMEGLYLKLEHGGVVVDRLKWVRADFTAQILSTDTHWLDRPIVPNGLAGQRYG